MLKNPNTNINRNKLAVFTVLCGTREIWIAFVPHEGADQNATWNKKCIFKRYNYDKNSNSS